MSTAKQLKDTIVGYLGAAWLLALKPHQFFKTATPLPNYKAKALFVLPPTLIFAAGASITAHKVWLAPVLIAAAYAGIALWALALKYVLLFFAEKRSFADVLHIASCSAIALTIAWIPVVGAPAFYLLVGVYGYLGLTRHFKMHGGAALAAVALPVVILGVGGGILSFVFMWLASVSTLFSGH